MKPMPTLDLGGAQEIILPSTPSVRAGRVMDFFLKCRSTPFEKCQSARIDVPVMLFFPDNALPKFTGESDKNLFIREVSTTVGLSTSSAKILADVLDRMERVMETFNPQTPAEQEAGTIQLDLPFPSEAQAPDSDPGHEDSPQELDDSRAGDQGDDGVGGA